MEKNKLMKKNFIWNMVGGTVYPFISLVLLIIVTRINGENDAGIFTYAFTLTLLFAYVSQYFGRTYQVTDINKNITNKDFLISRYITCIISVIMTIILIFINSYDMYKITIIVLLTIWKTIESIIEVFFGMLHKNNELYKVGESLFLRTVIIIAVFFIIDKITKNLIYSTLSLSISVIFVFLIYDLKNLKKLSLKNEHYSVENIKRIIKTGFLPFAINVLSYYYINSTKLSLEGILSNDIQAIFGILIMPTTVMLLFNQYIIAPLLTKIRELINENKYLELRRLTTKLILLVLFLGIITTILGVLIGLPVMELMYGVNLKEYTMCFGIILVGAIFYSLSYLLSNILVSIRKNFAQFIIYLIFSIISFFIAPIIVSKGISNASILYAIQMFVLIVTIIIIIYYYFEKEIKRKKE